MAFRTAVSRWFADTEEVTGSNPVAPTTQHPSSGRVRGPGILAQSPGAKSSGSKRAATANGPAGRQPATGAMRGTAGRPAHSVARAAGPQHDGWGDSNSGPPLWGCLAVAALTVQPAVPWL